MEPQLIGIKGGWAAVAADWAVFGETKEEAVNNFRRADAQHQEILSRADGFHSGQRNVNRVERPQSGIINEQLAR